MKKILALVLCCMAIFALVSCNEKSVKSDGKANSENVGKIDDKIDENVLIPDDSYVLYKETYTSTGVDLIYEYNEKGHLTKIVKTLPDTRVEETTLEYTYFEDGGYTVHEKSQSTEHIRTFDKDGRLIKEIREPESKRLMRCDTYTYGDDGIVYMESRDIEDEVKRVEKHTYNEKNLMVKLEQFLEDGTPIGSVEYYYDENGNLTKNSFVSPNGERNSNDAEFKWTQEYDKYGRLVKKEKRDTANNGLSYDEIYEYNDEEGAYTVTSETALFKREYRPLSICIR